MTQAPAQRGPCPYCNESEAATTYARREHVVPQAFGRFEHNLIAWNVCDACNEFFDRELDRILARGTYEGFLRFSLGQKRADEYKHVGSDARLRFEARSGPWTGMHLQQRLSPSGDALMMEPARQIGFSKTAADEPTYYPVSGAPSKERCVELYGSDVYVRAVGFDSQDEVRETLRLLGFTEVSALHGDSGIVTDNTTIRVEQIVTADRLVFRAMAKIAVNYLDARFPQLSRMALFRAICDFVRFGRYPPFRPVTASFEPIIGNELKGHRFLGHIVTLRHDQQRDEIRSSVALYNQIRYDVLLSPSGFHTVVPSEFMTTGSVFDTTNHVIHDLTHATQLPGRLLIETS